jgi:DNA-binding beta-propeller fold protein YncE
LAYDPVRHTVWTTNESSGSETVVDADTGQVRGTVSVGGEAGNVVYDPNSAQMLVAVQGRNDLAVIDRSRSPSPAASLYPAATMTTALRSTRPIASPSWHATPTQPYSVST